MFPEPGSNKRLLITGGTGYIGSKLAGYLSRVGREVAVLTRSSVGSAAGVNCIVHDGSVASISAALERVQPEQVIHLAAHYVRRHEPGDVARLVEANVAFGTALLESMNNQGCRRLIHAASAFQRSATAGGGARNLYAATKNAFEEILRFYEASGYVDGLRMTVCDVYGEDDPRPRLMNALVSAAVTGSVLTIPRHDPYLVPVHIDDTVNAFATACEIPLNDERTFWVGPKDAILLSELLDLVARLIGSRVTTVHADFPALPGDTLVPVPDPFLPGWDPQVGIELGMMRMIESYRSGRGPQ